MAPLRKTSPDPIYDAAAALMANATGGDMREIRSMAQRLARLVRRLGKFSFPLVAQPLADLLIRPENHTATARIEALIHLAALACGGKREPTRGQLREWLNVLVFQDPITGLEGPVEDVFVSNVVTWFGNARLFEGRWQNNGDYVQTCIGALLRIAEHPWAAETLRHIMAMLLISEAVAERAQIVRNVRTESQPREAITVSVSTVPESAGHVSFSHDELVAIGVDPTDLDLFVFQGEHTDLLVEESIGHTALERRPLVRFGGRTIVALPTAIGAAVRRFVIERAVAAGDLGTFQSVCDHAQFGEVLTLGRAAWDIRYIDALKHDLDDKLGEFAGTFDDGGYVHIIYVPDDLEEAAQEGITSSHTLKGMIKDRVRDHAACLAAEPDYRRGLTVLVHGGIGRGFSPEWGDLPSGWHQLCLSVPDFMLLGNESEFTAMRAWKLLQQVDGLEEKGVVFPNLRGFLNLAAFAYYNDFELVPVNMTHDPIYLHSDFILPLRHRVRAPLDRHAAIAPDGEGWVSVQRETTGDFLGQTQGRPVFISPGHMAQRELLACVETAVRPWWVRCIDPPVSGWHHSIVFNILKMVLGWLIRVAPMLEKRLSALPSGPVTYCFRFPDIESFRQNNVQTAEMSLAPAFAVEDGQIVIDCTPRYLRSFLSADNLGDRLMIAALVRGAHAFCGNPVPSDAAMGEFVQTVVGSDDARFFQMTPSRAPQDAIYDAAALPEPRLLMPEDQAWSHLDLARRAGYQSAPGSIPSCQARAILEKAVDKVWERVKSRLSGLSRESVIERSLLNFVAVQKDHRDWHRTAAAQLALYDNAEVLAAANERGLRRDTAGLACRVIAEMALCTSPYRVGSVCTGTDLDFLIGEVATLLECASQSDALRYGLAARQPIMYPNGSFGFDPSTAQAIGPLLKEHGRRTYREARADHGTGFGSGAEGEIGSPDFEAAFVAEFGLGMEQYGEFVLRVTEEALEQRSAHLRLRRSEVTRRLREAGAPNPERVFESFVLVPRARWDEKCPVNANKRDWYPWRFSRRLSILRRPLVQFSTEGDPVVLVMPSLLAGTLDYLQQASLGRLPEDLFDSREMISCIGRAADRNGHEFNRRVAGRLDELKWKTRQELSLTQLGGEPELGDIDVLAWWSDTGLVFAVECKSLRFDRTYGEIGERLAEYATGTVDGKRTSLQKHLDRVSYLEANQERLSHFTDIPVGRLQLHSALVTEKLVAMQFAGVAQDTLDLVTDYELLDEAFGDP